MDTTSETLDWIYRDRQTTNDVKLMNQKKWRKNFHSCHFLSLEVLEGAIGGDLISLLYQCQRK